MEVYRPRPRRRPSATVVTAAAVLALFGCTFLLLSSSDKKRTGAIIRPAGGSRRLASKHRTFWKDVNDRPFRHIYFCNVSPIVAASLLPDEFDPKDTSSWSSSLSSGPPPTEDDLLFAGYAHAETTCGRDRPELNGRVLYFPGTMIFLNAEAADTQGGPRPLSTKKLADGCHSLKGEKTCDQLQGTTESQAPELEEPGRRFNYLPPSDRAYVLGPHPDSDRSVRVSAAAQEWFHSPWESMRWMWDPASRPRNSGEHFAVFLASHCVPFRDAAVKEIARLGEVHVGDDWLQFCGRLVPDFPGARGSMPRISAQPDHTPRSDYGENHQIMRKYKFAIVMENTYRKGYITEKIGMAFRSGAVPIWYGGKDALDMYNPDAFIYFDVENPKPALERIKYLMDHPDEYERMLQVPILRDGNRTIEEYFSLRDDVGGGRLKNRIRRMIGLDVGSTDETRGGLGMASRKIS